MQAGQVLAAAECVPQIVQVCDKPSRQEQFMDFCTSSLLLKSRPSQRWIILACISQIKDCLETECSIFDSIWVSSSACPQLGYDKSNVYVFCLGGIQD